MSVRSSRGFTLVEIVVLIVVLSAALVGLLLVFQNTVRASADPQVQKQAVAVAEALLDEILLASYDNVAGAGSRANFNDVGDYDLYSTTGVNDIQGNPVPGLEAYNVNVVVAPPAAINETTGTLTAVGEARRVTVTVTNPTANVAISLDGYRMRYAGP